MSQNNNGNNNYVNFAVGWMKTSKAGKQYISGAANGERQKVKLLCQLEDGTQVPINSFFVSFAESKPSEKAPDAQFTFTLES